MRTPLTLPMKHLIYILLIPILILGAETGECLRLSEALVRSQLAERDARLEWEESRALLLGRIAASQTALDKANIQASQQQSDIQREQERLSSLNAHIREAESLQNATETALEAASQRLDRIWGSLPKPLQDTLVPIRKRLNQKEAPLSERIHSILAIHGECAAFDRKIHLVKQILPGADGVMREHDVIYVGLSAAYAYATGSSCAGYGKPSPNGYTWHWSKQYIPEVQKAVAILSHRRSADLVSLPLQK